MESHDTPWTFEMEANSAGRWRRIAWRLTPAGLRAALLGPASPRQTRSIASGRTTNILLLSDVIALEDGQIAINVMVSPDNSAPGCLLIEAHLAADDDLGGPLRATLRYGNRTLTAGVDAGGRAAFAGVPAEALIHPESGEAITDLSIAIERPGESL